MRHALNALETPPAERARTLQIKQKAHVRIAADGANGFARLGKRKRSQPLEHIGRNPLSHLAFGIRRPTVFALEATPHDPAFGRKAFEPVTGNRTADPESRRGIRGGEGAVRACKTSQQLIERVVSAGRAPRRLGQLRRGRPRRSIGAERVAKKACVIKGGPPAGAADSRNECTMRTRQLIEQRLGFSKRAG